MRQRGTICGNQCADMQILSIKQSQELEKSDIQALLTNTFFQTFQQIFSVSSPVATILFIFYNITPDHPIPQRGYLIDGLNRQSTH